MGYFDESETFKQSCPGGIKKEPIVHCIETRQFMKN